MIGDLILDPLSFIASSTHIPRQKRAFMTVSKIVVALIFISGLLLTPFFLAPQFYQDARERPTAISEVVEQQPQAEPDIVKGEVKADIPNNKSNENSPKVASIQQAARRQIINGTFISASIRVIRLNPGSGHPNLISVPISMLNANSKLKQIIQTHDELYAQYLQKCKPTAKGICTEIYLEPPTATSIALNSTEAVHLATLLQLTAESQTTGKGGVIEIREVKRTRIIERAGANLEIIEVVQEEALVRREPKPGERVVGNWISANYVGTLLYEGTRYGILVIVAFEK